MTKAGMRLREDLATLRAENAQLVARLEKYETDEQRRRTAEERLARQYDNMFRYTGAAQADDLEDE